LADDELARAIRHESAAALRDWWVMNDKAEEQRRLIPDQFTRQAVPFAQVPAHSNDDMAQVGPEGAALDGVAPPGLLTSPPRRAIILVASLRRPPQRTARTWPTPGRLLPR
jgi:hypothetical protein